MRKRSESRQYNKLIEKLKENHVDSLEKFKHVSLMELISLNIHMTDLAKLYQLQTDIM